MGSAEGQREREYFNFDGQDFEFKVILDNGEVKTSFGESAVKMLVINEDLFRWHIKGVLVLDNSMANIERPPNFGVPQLQQGFDDLAYKFRNDGRDLLRFFIKPDPNSKSDPALPTIEMEDGLWRIAFDAFVYDIEVHGDELHLKFWEREYGILSEKNVEFTTSNVGKNKDLKDPERASNEERSLRTGEALLELFKSVPEIGESKVDEENWDLGSEDNKVFYTSTTNSSVVDDVEYIKMRHTGEEQDFDLGVLKFERSTSASDKKFTLKPMKKYFEHSGDELYTEVFFMSEFHEADQPQGHGGGDVAQKKVPDSDMSPVGYNEIIKFQFTESSPQRNRILSQPTFMTHYNSDYGQFNIDVVEHTPEKALKYMKEKYLPSVVGKDVRYTLNKWKKEGDAVFTKYSLRPTKEGRLAFGRNPLINLGINDNMEIQIEVKGSTLRQVGKFFGVRKKTRNDTDYDNRLEGQYLAVNVAHIFIPESKKYVNRLTGVKMHVFQDKKRLDEDDTKLMSDGATLGQLQQSMNVEPGAAFA